MEADDEIPTWKETVKSDGTSWDIGKLESNWLKQIKLQWISWLKQIKLQWISWFGQSGRYQIFYIIVSFWHNKSIDSYQIGIPKYPAFDGNKYFEMS